MSNYKKFCVRLLASGTMGMLAAMALAQDEPGLSISVEQLKQEVIEINKELGVLEQQLLFPANTQVSVFLSVNVGEFFQLDAVSLKIDDKQVANYLYTEKQVDALMRGGIQRLHVGNVSKGRHELTAFFTGRGPQGRDFRRGVSHEFTKEGTVNYLELKIEDSEKLHQPVLSVKEWR